MRLDATDAGRLVRLADVALWLIESGGLPRVPAVERLADALDVAKPAPALFMVQAGNYAQPIEGSAARFGYHTVDSWAVEEIAQERLAAMRRDPWRFNLPDAAPGSLHGMPPRALSAAAMDEIRAAVAAGARPAVTLVDERARALCDPGVPALLRLLRKRWTFARWGNRTDAEIFTDPKLPGFAVAVRVADAARIWGWGAATDQAPAPVELATYADVVKHRRENPGAPWDAPPNQIDLLRTEETRANDAGEKGVRARMAKDFSVTSRRIGQLLRKTEPGSRAKQRAKGAKVQALPGLKAV